MSLLLVPQFTGRTKLTEPGIQCHTAPYSWKLVFLCDHQLYEIIMTACTVREEQEWRTRLSHASGREAHAPSQPMLDSLALNIKALGTVFGKQGKPPSPHLNQQHSDRAHTPKEPSPEGYLYTAPRPSAPRPRYAR